jgi:hypothetical protein
MNLTDIIGTIGVTILLVAFFLNLFKYLDPERPTYITLNILGSAIACYASILLRYVPFIVLEATWGAVSVIGLIKYFRK